MTRPAKTELTHSEYVALCRQLFAAVRSQTATTCRDVNSMARRAIELVDRGDAEGIRAMRRELKYTPPKGKGTKVCTCCDRGTAGKP